MRIEYKIFPEDYGLALREWKNKEITHLDLQADLILSKNKDRVSCFFWL